MDRRDFYLNRYGQKTVSRLFEVMAAILTNHLPAGALLGRYGSGSFALQVPVSLEQARRLAEKLRLAICKHRLTVDTEKVSLTVSIGVSARDASAPDFLSLLRGADIGLYLARGDNGNAVRVQH
jgi:diguanylate cyclase (GGDEF)-like protein